QICTSSCRWRRFTSLTTSRRSTPSSRDFPTYRKLRASTPVFIAPTHRSLIWYPFHATSAKQVCSDMVFTDCRTSILLQFFQRLPRKLPGGASSLLTSEAARAYAH